MTIQMSKRDIRQHAYRERARSARGYARMLMPVVFIVLGTALWQDPKLGPVLAEGLTEVKPLAASYLQDTPFEDLLGPVPSEETASANQDAQITVSASLPTSVLPIDRN